MSSIDAQAQTYFSYTCQFQSVAQSVVHIQSFLASCGSWSSCLCLVISPWVAYSCSGLQVINSCCLDPPSRGCCCSNLLGAESSFSLVADAIMMLHYKNRVKWGKWITTTRSKSQSETLKQSSYLGLECSAALSRLMKHQKEVGYGTDQLWFISPDNFDAFILSSRI